MDDKYILEEISKEKEKLVEDRRSLHKLAELSSKEFKTSAYLKDEVRKLGLPIVEIEGTGFYAILDSKRPGKTIGLRADIDALPICESPNNLSKNREVKSNDENVFHACGHDGHMAILLTSMKILKANIDKLTGRIIFIFEEAEETGLGIGKMLDKLKEENIDYFYGNHLASFLKTGEIALDPGPVMAGFAMVDFTIKGVGGHSSRPDKAVSPIFAQAAVIQSLSSAFVNRLDPDKAVTLGLSTINGGHIHNVIADEVRITGTLRYFDKDEGEKALDLIKDIGDGVARAHGCSFVINKIEAEHDPVVNDSYLSELMIKELSPYFGDKLLRDTRWYASESFEAYGKLAPSLFSLVGIANEEKGSGAEHHTPEFDLDEDALSEGVFAMVKFALVLLSKK